MRKRITNGSVFLDSNVVQKITTKSQGHDLQKRLKGDFKLKYVLSPMTAGEALRGLYYSDPTYFAQHKERIWCLLNGDPTTLTELPLPAQFVFATVLQLPVGPAETTRQTYKRALKTVVAASSKDEIEKYDVRVSRKRTMGVTLKPLVQNYEAAMGIYVSELKLLKDRTTKRGTAEEWAEASFSEEARTRGHKISAEGYNVIGQRLAAAFSVFTALSVMAQNTGKNQYKFEEHPQELIDVLQLMYLCDPKMHILTGDKRLRDKALKASEANRILLFDDVMP
jgi:hypothetical protein